MKGWSVCIFVGVVVIVIGGLSAWALWLGYNGAILTSSIAAIVALPVYFIARRRNNGN